VIFLDYLNPLRYIPPSWYQHGVESIFLGTTSKILSIVSLVIGFYLLARRENVSGFIMLLILSFLFAYMGGIISIL